jgi:hypothetical protein
MRVVIVLRGKIGGQIFALPRVPKQNGVEIPIARLRLLDERNDYLSPLRKTEWLIQSNLTVFDVASACHRWRPLCCNYIT